MEAVKAQLPALQVLLPLFGAALVAFLRGPRLAFAVALGVSLLMPVIALGLLWQVMADGAVSYAMGGWPPPIGIEYRVDALNAPVLLLVSLVGAVIMPYARHSVAQEIDPDRQPWFYCMYLLCLSGLLGVTITGDAFNAFVFLEIASLSTYVLIALGRDRRALLAAFQYLIMGTIGATFYVIGVGFLYVLTGTLNMADMAQRLVEVEPDQMRSVVIALAFLAVGVSLKLALFPLHVWLPNAYAYAPSWVTVFLAATATKVAVYLLVRYLFMVFRPVLDIRALPVDELIVGLSVAAMFVASFAAVFETNIKRMLAYSSVAQVGYITLGIGLANQAGLTGGLAHLANHAVMKAALFLAIGAVFFRAVPMKLAEMAGLGRRMPVTMAAFTVAGLGLVGTPGTAGFISKWYLAVGALDRGWWLLAFLIVGTSLIAMVYIGKVLEVVWLREPSPASVEASDPPLAMMLPILVMAGAAVWFGLDTSWTVGLATAAASLLVGGGG